MTAAQPIDLDKKAFEAWSEVQYRNADVYTQRDYELGLEAWRAALARQQHEPSGNAGEVAASIGKDPAFREHFASYQLAEEAYARNSNDMTLHDINESWELMVAYIDAQLARRAAPHAQAEPVGYISEGTRAMLAAGCSTPITISISTGKAAVWCAPMYLAAPVPRAQAEPVAWISVNDRLPPIGNEVLVYRPGSDRGKITALARFISYEGARDYYWDNSYPGKGNMHLSESITHWWPMPDAAPVPQEAEQAAPAAQSEEILSLHRQLAGERLRADQGWERAEAKSRECLELRDRMAAPAAVTDGIRGPLTDAQRDHLRALYRNLHHLGPDAMEDVVRAASVAGYVNGRIDFSEPATPAVTDAARDVLAEIDTILKGIDQQETQSENGWWETSAGAEFGMKKLREVRAAINAAMRTQSKE